VVLPKTPCWTCVSSTIQEIVKTRNLTQEQEKKARDASSKLEEPGWETDQDSNGFPPPPPPPPHPSFDETPPSISDFPHLIGGNSLEGETSGGKEVTTENSVFLIF
jgi:hypothetical protein